MESLIFETIALLKREMPELLTIDEDYGQLEALRDGAQDMYPLTFPAVLIEAPSAHWSNLADGSQKGECTLRVRLCIDCYDDTHAGSGTERAILLRDGKVKALHRLLQGFRPGDDGPLVRTESRFYTFTHGIKVYESTYTCTATDTVTRTQAPAAPPRFRLVRAGRP